MPEAVMRKVNGLFQESGLSLEQLGQHMGYEEGNARKSAWQFLNKTSDPRLSMLLRFADAVGVSADSLLVDPIPESKPNKPKKRLVVSSCRTE